MTITPALVAEHGLTQEEYDLVVRTLGRTPTITELGIVSVMWSEHASYKNSVKYLKTLPKTGSAMLAEAGEENAGVVDVGDGLAVAFKIESHNHPSALEPYHGAATGVGGILRDIFTMGARPIAALNSLRFGNPDNPAVKRLMQGVVSGIADYGNCFGVPTVGGEIYFEDSYEGNPLVNAMAVGVMKKDVLMRAAAGGVGNLVVYVGSETGRDGIHGATFASADLSAATQEKRTAVQVGDPFMEKLLLEATLEVIEAGLAVAVQDMGAAGLTCSTSEMAAKGQVGVDIDVALVPRREPGMTAYEVMLSESQERMLMIVEPAKLEALQTVFAKWDLHAVSIGVVTEDGLLRVRDEGTVVAELPAGMLTLGQGAPVYSRDYKRPAHLDETFDWQKLPVLNNLGRALETLMASPNIASKRAVYTQYDHMVQTGTVQEPGGEAAVVRLPGSDKAVALCTDCNGRHVWLDPYNGTAGAVAEAARNVACTGAKPLAITNCLNFGNPYKPEVYYTFIEAINGMGDACRAFDTPVTGGNVSFYNENPQGAVYPTPVIGMLGLLDDWSKAVPNHFTSEGDLVILLGKNCGELGGSQYLATLHNLVAGPAPVPDLDRERNLQQLLVKLADKRLASSAHDCADGGLAVAIAESCFGLAGKNLGVAINMELIFRPEAELFGEAHGRVVLSAPEKNWEMIQWLAEEHNIPARIIGRVEGEAFSFNDLLKIPVNKLRTLWEDAITL